MLTICDIIYILFFIYVLKLLFNYLCSIKENYSSCNLSKGGCNYYAPYKKKNFRCQNYTTICQSEEECSKKYDSNFGPIDNDFFKRTFI